MRLLLDMGFNKKYLVDNLGGLKWEISDNGFIYSGCNIRTLQTDLLGISLNIRPYVLGWTPKVLKQINEPWLEISLLFHVEEIMNDDKNQIRHEIKLPLWNAMVHISKCFSETGIYLTDELTDGMPWEASLRCNDNVWSFHAAIIPAEISALYKDLHDNYIRKEANGNIYLIDKTFWGAAPWQKK